MSAPDGERSGATLATVLALLVILLVEGAALAAVVAALVRLAGTAAEAVRFLFQESPDNPMASSWRWEPPPSAWGGPRVAQHRQNTHRRAAYLAAASQRLSRAYESGGIEGLRAARDREATYWRQHLQAQQVRMRAAGAVEDQMEAPGVLMGWYARMDDRTSDECRAANGRNFDPGRIPPIGYPGSVHPHCRCRAGLPFVTAKRVESIRPDHARRAA